MNVLEISTLDQEHITLKGDLTFASINKKTVQVIDFGHSHCGHNINIDLSEINSSDSAGLALMIEWIKLSKQHNTEINFNHIPDQLLALAKLSGLENNHYFIQ